MNPDESPTPNPLGEPLNIPTTPSSAAAFSSSASLTPSSSLGVGSSAIASSSDVIALEKRIAELRIEEQRLRQEVSNLQASYGAALRSQTDETQQLVSRLVKEGLGDLEQRRQTLQLSIEQLERRQERIKAEMQRTFAGASQDLAIRIQGFKDYLVGSLQDLVAAAEQIELTPKVSEAPRRDRREPGREPGRESSREPGREPREAPRVASRETEDSPTPRFAEQAFQEQNKQIRRLLDQYRTAPDYYGAPWQLRRTFEPIHAERVSNWFFTQGGRGALRTMGSRLQNILISSAIISILRDQHGDRLRTLVLGDSPECLGEWRRGLQDCLGISRADFGADQGIVLFEAGEPLAQRADRLVKQKLLPLIIIDESEDRISLSVLQFPLWLAFAPDPNRPAPTYY